MKAWNMAWNTAEVSVAGTDARVIQVRRTGKGCLSYLVGSGGEAAVIDASLDPEVYIELANSADGRLLRARHARPCRSPLSSWSRGLAELVGATLHMPEGVPLAELFSALGEGETLEVGTARLEAGANRCAVGKGLVSTERGRSAPPTRLGLKEELAAVRVAGPGQRLCRGHGGPGAHRRAPRRLEGVRPRPEDGHGELRRSTCGPGGTA